MLKSPFFLAEQNRLETTGKYQEAVIYVRSFVTNYFFNCIYFLILPPRKLLCVFICLPRLAYSIVASRGC